MAPLADRLLVRVASDADPTLPFREQLRLDGVIGRSQALAQLLHQVALVAPLTAATRREANRSLLQVERALVRPQGLRTRPWYRNLIYVADENNGYANMSFPSVNEAIRAGDAALSAREIVDLAQRFDAATAALNRAQRVLAGGR